MVNTSFPSFFLFKGSKPIMNNTSTLWDVGKQDSGLPAIQELGGCLLLIDNMSKANHNSGCLPCREWLTSKVKAYFTHTDL